MISGIIGLDLSITGSGVVRYDISEKRYSFISTIGTKPDFGSMLQRFEYSARGIIPIIQKDDIVFIEDYAYGIGKGVSRLASLAELGGIIKFLINRKTKKIPIQVASTSIKKWFSGSGKLPHSDFKIEAYKKYKREFKTKDEVIAYSLADLGYHLLLPPMRELFKYEQDVIKNFKKKHSEILHTCAEGITGEEEINYDE
jgi:hypothetical protein